MLTFFGGVVQQIVSDRLNFFLFCPHIDYFKTFFNVVISPILPEMATWFIFLIIRSDQFYLWNEKFDILWIFFSYLLMIIFWITYLSTNSDDWYLTWNACCYHVISTCSYIFEPLLRYILRLLRTFELFL